MGVSAIPHKYVAVVAVGIAALAIAFSPPRIGLVVAFIALSGVVLAVGALLERSRRESTAPLHDLGEAVEQVAATQHEERLAARHRATTLDERLQEYREAIERPAPPVPPPPGTVRLRRAQDLLWCGFSSEGLERLRSLGSDMDVTESVRSESHRSLANWYTAAGEGARAREHAHLADTGRATYVGVTDEEAVEAFGLLSRHEGIIPAMESSHAIAEALRIAREREAAGEAEEMLLLVNLSGRGDKDMHEVREHLS